MAITLGLNIAALRGQRQLSRTSDELGTVFQRLSSGQRINQASDDPAGLAMADSLKSDSTIFKQAIRNLNDGQSLLSVADASIENLTFIMTRLEELATQAGNGVYTVKQREALDTEAQALSKEFLRISKSTDFNGQSLFTGQRPQFSLQAGAGNNAVITASVGGAIGTGSFGAATSYLAEATKSYGLDLGDLNGDGFLDLVTAGYAASGGYATVRLGTGSGSFGAATSYATEAGGSGALNLGDVNGDGFLDLVTAGGDGIGDGWATVRLGTGSGSFGAATSYATEASWSEGLDLGDVNRDGILDLVTAGGDDINNGWATVRLGTGSGSFGAATSYATEAQVSWEVSLGDLNGDGILDLVTAGGDDSSNGWATVRLGTGSGSFGAATSFTTESLSSYALKLGDVNGDGSLDLLTAGLEDAVNGYATVRLGTGSGSFGAATSYATESSASTAINLGDLNGDGFLDLVTAGTIDGFNGYATVRFGTGTGSFGTATSYATEARVSQAVELGDVNGDGLFDLVTAGWITGYDGYATVRLGSGVAGAAPLLEFSLATLADARQALPVFQRKREQLSAQRGEIGAYQSRIDVARNVLEVTSENFRAAESRIRDADIAEESSRLVRLNILQQAATAILAQANQQPALALQLLRG